MLQTERVGGTAMSVHSSGLAGDEMSDTIKEAALFCQPKKKNLICLLATFQRQLPIRTPVSFFAQRA